MMTDGQMMMTLTSLTMTMAIMALALLLLVLEPRLTQRKVVVSRGVVQPNRYAIKWTHGGTTDFRERLPLPPYTQVNAVVTLPAPNMMRLVA